MSGRFKQLIKKPAIFIPCLVIVGLIVVMFVAVDKVVGGCKDIRLRNTPTTATVTYLQLYEQTRSRFKKEILTNDPMKATALKMQVSYSVDGTSYTETVFAYYNNPGAMTELYRDAQDGQLSMRYQTDKPSAVRPELEFTPQAIADKLCESP